jgi:hypothetical protein
MSYSSGRYFVFFSIIFDVMVTALNVCFSVKKTVTTMHISRRQTRVCHARRAWGDNSGQQIFHDFPKFENVSEVLCR